MDREKEKSGETEELRTHKVRLYAVHDIVDACIIMLYFSNILFTQAFGVHIESGYFVYEYMVPIVCAICCMIYTQHRTQCWLYSIYRLDATMYADDFLFFPCYLNFFCFFGVVVAVLDTFLCIVLKVFSFDRFFLLHIHLVRIKRRDKQFFYASAYCIRTLPHHFGWQTKTRKKSAFSRFST